MSSLTLLGDTSGSIVLDAPAVAGSSTITLPAATGTMMVSGNMPAFSAYQSSAQTLSTATFTKIQYQTEEFDTASAYDNATNYRFTPQVAGYYQVVGAVQFGSSTTCAVRIYKNGSNFKQVFNSVVSSVSTGCGTALIYMNGSTDYIEIFAYLGLGQALTADVTTTFFQATMVRAA
jgi:hypothetical protein